MKQIFIILTSLLITSCSSMVSGYYKQLDGNKSQTKNSKKSFSHLTAGQRSQSSEYNKILLPSTKRLYTNRNTNHKKTRVLADNFHSSDNQASLWTTPHATNLYTAQSSITSGDIVIINVLGDLKSDIASELKRAFPVKIKKHANKSLNKEESASNKTSKEDSSDEGLTKIHDRISSIVVDSISDSYITIRGKKELMYHNNKHSVEIQALVNKKDISSNNYIKSDSIIEKTIRVLY